MNLSLKDIVKQKLQKLLNIIFIYPITGSQWMFSLVIILNKIGKWRIYVDYQEFNKDTQKYHFPLPFIN